MARLVARLVMGYVWLVIRSRALAAICVGALVVGTGIATWSLMPKLEYLPAGNRIAI